MPIIKAQGHSRACSILITYFQRCIYFCTHVLVLLCTVSVLTVSANTIDNPQADKIFTRMDQGGHIPPDEAAAMFLRLEELIASNDTERKMRFNALKCWDQKTSTAEEIAQATKFADKWLNHANAKIFPKSRIDLILCKSSLLEMNSETDAAMAGYKQGIEDAYRIEDSRLIADARSLRGELLSFQGDFSAALEDLITAQHLYDNLGLQNWSLYNLGAIATSYRRFGDPQNAIRYFTQQAKAYAELNNVRGATLIDTEIGFALEELGEYQQALERHLNVYRYNKENKNDADAANAAVDIAGALIQLERVNEALEYLTEAKPIVTPDSVGIYSFLYYRLAQVHAKKGKFEKALNFNLVAQQEFTANKNLRGLQRSLELQSQILSKQGQWQPAFEAQIQFFDIHKQLDKKLQSRRTAEIRGRFNADKMEAENQHLLEYKKLKENEQIITEQNKMLQLTVLILALVIIMILAVFIFKQIRRAKMLEALALTDHLTQLPNRRHIYVRGEREFTKSKNQDTDFSIILFDADHFKQVNDAFGHDVGDSVLVTLAQSSASLMRKGDVVGRIGGEEFLILLRETPANQALLIAERLVQAIANQNLDHIDPGFNITISAGVASLSQQADFTELFNCADKALYQAKESGRNCVKRAD